MCITCEFPSCSWRKSKGHVGCLAKHCMKEHSQWICASEWETFQIPFHDIKKSNVFLLIHKTHRQKHELYWFLINTRNDGFFLNIFRVHTAPKRFYQISLRCHRFGKYQSDRLVVKDMPRNNSDLSYSLKISQFLTEKMCSSAKLKVRIFDDIFTRSLDIATNARSESTLDISGFERLQTRRRSTRDRCQTPGDYEGLDRLTDADRERSANEPSSTKKDIEISEPCIICRGFQTRNFLKVCGNAHFTCRLCFLEGPRPKRCLACGMNMDESELSESDVEIEFDFEYYRCPICTDFIKSKARYCLEGHLVCNVCFCKLLENQYNICPICRNEYPDDNICAEIEETLKTLTFPEE